jgi:hypothetical protein
VRLYLYQGNEHHRIEHNSSFLSLNIVVKYFTNYYLPKLQFLIYQQIIHITLIFVLKINLMYRRFFCIYNYNRIEQEYLFTNDNSILYDMYEFKNFFVNKK